MHRDMKSENILMSSDEGVKIAHSQFQREMPSDARKTYNSEGKTLLSHEGILPSLSVKPIERN